MDVDGTDLRLHHVGTTFDDVEENSEDVHLLSKSMLQHVALQRVQSDERARACGAFPGGR